MTNVKMNSRSQTDLKRILGMLQPHQWVQKIAEICSFILAGNDANVDDTMDTDTVITKIRELDPDDVDIIHIDWLDRSHFLVVND